MRRGSRLTYINFPQAVPIFDKKSKWVALCSFQKNCDKLHNSLKFHHRSINNLLQVVFFYVITERAMSGAYSS